MYDLQNVGWVISLMKWNGHPTSTSLIQCPCCEEWILLTDWLEGETDCDECGYHFALRCPLCSCLIDQIWGDPLNIK